MINGVNNKWKDIEDRIEKKTQAETKKQQFKTDLPAVSDSPDVVSAKGVVEQVKAKGVERRARIEALTIRTKGQLEVWVHQVKNSVIVAKRKIDVHAEEQLEHIWRQHIQNLTEIGISNIDARIAALQDLSGRSAKQLLEIQNMDVPDFMKEKLIDAVHKEYATMFDRIQADELSNPIT